VRGTGLRLGGAWGGAWWLSLCTCLFALAARAEYQWPLDLPREITSSFGEFRTGRFHAGIDLRTGGNRPVRAIGDGHISRVRCAPSGYGKAIYLRLDDGRTAVYAHLNDYTDALRSYVHTAQHAQESYTVDLFPGPTEFRVRSGEVIGETGRTGTHAPHLHFELRNPEEVAIDPYAAGLIWPDGTIPVVQRILVSPRDPASQVSGRFTPAVLDVVHHGHGKYSTAPVAVQGHVGVGVEFIDPAPGGSKLSAQVLRLMQGEREHFRIQYDQIHYDDIGDGNLAYHPFLRDEGRFLLLWRWPGNDCAFYQSSPGDGWVAAGGEEQTLSLSIVDVAGNAAVVSIPLLPAQPAVAPAGAAASTSQGTWDISYTGQLLVITASFGGTELETPVLAIQGGSVPEAMEMNRVSDNRFEVGYLPPVAGAYTFSLRHPRVEAGERVIHFLSSEVASRTAVLPNIVVEVTPDAASTFLPLRVESIDPPKGGRLPRYGLAYDFWPHDAPLLAPLTLRFPLPEGAEATPRLKMYRSSGGGWSPEPTEVEGNELVVRTRRLGTFQAMEDNQPPVLSDILPAEGYRASSKRPYVRAKISDQGSGIASVRVTCAGQWLLVAHDAVRGMVEWERDVELPSGEQQVLFEVRDNAGNVTSITRTVVIP